MKLVFAEKIFTFDYFLLVFSSSTCERELLFKARLCMFDIDIDNFIIQCKSSFRAWSVNVVQDPANRVDVKTTVIWMFSWSSKSTAALHCYYVSQEMLTHCQSGLSKKTLQCKYARTQPKKVRFFTQKSTGFYSTIILFFNRQKAIIYVKNRKKYVFRVFS